MTAASSSLDFRSRHWCFLLPLLVIFQLISFILVLAVDLYWIRLKIFEKNRFLDV